MFRVPKLHISIFFFKVLLIISIINSNHSNQKKNTMRILKLCKAFFSRFISFIVDKNITYSIYFSQNKYFFSQNITFIFPIFFLLFTFYMVTCTFEVYPIYCLHDTNHFSFPNMSLDLGIDIYYLG